MIDLAAVVTSLVLICAYQYYLRLRLRKDPLYTVHELTDSEPGEMFDFRPPQTADQLVAVTLSLAFVDAMQRDDTTAACGLAAEKAARVLRCARARPRAVKCGSNRVYDVEQDNDDVIDVLVGTCRIKVRARKAAKTARLKILRLR